MKINTGLTQAWLNKWQVILAALNINFYNCCIFNGAGVLRCANNDLTFNKSGAVFNCDTAPTFDLSFTRQPVLGAEAGPRRQALAERAAWEPVAASVLGLWPELWKPWRAC